MMKEKKEALYCESLTRYTRWETREVQIGNLPMGGKNPIRIQSMTTSDTRDTKATVAQSLSLAKVGSEYVRITAPSKTDAQNLKNIKDELRAAGCNVPLVADIHFTPNAAEIAAEIVEKVRVNPGNYADKKKFQSIDYSDEAYAAELQRIRKKFLPLVMLCKANGTAMRIGTNHGSLSDRIMSRYGDTPLGMVESAMEFLRICREVDFHDIVLSMKASNPQVMVQAYRLLVKTMKENGMNYPLHLGVTEAGDGEDARIKSAMGIGALLEDGLGDTIRVSLTERPEAEIPVAKELVKRYENRHGHADIEEIQSLPYDPYRYQRRASRKVNRIGGDQIPVVIAKATADMLLSPLELRAIGYHYDVLLDKWQIGDAAADFLYVGKDRPDFELPGMLSLIADAESWLPDEINTYPLFDAKEYEKASYRSPYVNFIRVSIQNLNNDFLKILREDDTVVLVLESQNEAAMPEMRRAFIKLMENDLEVPVIIKRSYTEESSEQFTLYSATDAGALFLDGMGDGIWLESKSAGAEKANTVAFGILQAARVRITRTEYISCPSCGRTLFDLEETTARIRQATHHLKGIKIGIMGCIVNGPGEMADADYGYVGSGPGKITLYKGQEVVKRNIPAENALEELIALIKSHGDWVEMDPVQTV